QASADPMVDHRADIYSWGILAYELLTGSTPFSGRPAAAMLAAHTIESAEPIARRRPGVPPALAMLVMKCLEKRASDRPQKAGEIVRALDDMVTPSGGLAPTHAVGTSTRRRRLVAAGIAVFAIVGLAFGYRAMSHARGTETGVRTIAVLPFENRSRDSTYDYLADGMSDELRSALNGVPGLGVKARSSSAALRGKSARDAGAKLDVGAVLEGSLSRSGERIRVTAELVRVADENTLWSGSFDRLATELPAVQDSILRAITRALEVRGDGPTAASGAGGARGTSDPEAYDLFLRGEFFRRRFDIPTAVHWLDRAVARDPSFARAHASLAAAYALLPLTGVTLGDSARRQAVKSVERALALAPSLPAVYVAQAQLEIFAGFRYDAAEHTIRKAIALDSADADARVWHAFALGYLGRLDDALAEARTAVRLDPLSTDAQIIVQALLTYRRQLPELVAATKAILELDPKSTIALGNLAQGYALGHRPDSAGLAADAILKIDAASYGVRSQVMFAYAAAGRWKDADEQRRLALEPGGNSPNYYTAVSSIIYGDMDTAMAAMERGIRAREPLWNTIFIACEPMFAPLRTRPRFVALIRELGATMCAPDDRWPITPRP
ncbi:MAG: protein kinase, partial [Gemmatimonadaceae bacterium]